MRDNRWINGRRPAPHFCVSSLSQCNRWSDLIRLAKWYVALWLDRSPNYCWVSLCQWAWFGMESPKQTGAFCEADGRKCGQCYCGKFNDLRERAAVAGAGTR